MRRLHRREPSETLFASGECGLTTERVGVCVRRHRGAWPEPVARAELRVVPFELGNLGSTDFSEDLERWIELRQERSANREG